MAGSKILLALTLGIILSACNNEQPDFVEEEVMVDFDYRIEGDCSTPVLEVIIENKTLNADSYLWDFGDGTTSNQVNPKKVYPKSGTYSIKLAASFSDEIVRIEKQINISRNSDGTGPLGQFSFERSSAPREVSFVILTEETRYTFSSGDGATIESGEKVIKHEYAAPGLYSVALIVENSEGRNCATARIDLSP